MTWIIIAILGHAANGFAFIIDKILLNNAFKRSATYAGLVGLLSALALVLIPWVTAWPLGGDLLLAILSGLTFMAALWTFFAALSRGEASRVIPIISALIPIMTLIGTSLFLAERLSFYELLGFFMLITATVILAGGKAQNRLTLNALLLSLLSAFLFAVSSVSGKAVYDSVGFLGGFTTTRIVAALTSVMLVMLVDPLAGEEIKDIVKSMTAGRQKKRSGQLMSMATAGKLAIVGQTLGGLGFIAIQYAISLGSASIVNALQVMQFALLVTAAFILKNKAQTLLGESLNKSVIIIKGLALVIMAIGLSLIV